MTAPQQTRRTPSTAGTHTWFPPASVRQLYDRITAVGPDSARLEVRVVGEKMLLRVVSADAGEMTTLDAEGDINDSRVCPPICPT